MTHAIENENVRSARAMYRADLVAVGIPELGKVGAARAKSQRVFAGRAGIRDPRCIERVRLLRRIHIEPDGAAIAVSCGLPVDRSRNCGEARRTRIGISVLVGEARTDAQRVEHGVVELLGNLEIIHTEHYMTEHSYHLVRSRYRARLKLEKPTLGTDAFGYPNVSPV
jgi:hypothetical protein